MSLPKAALALGIALVYVFGKRKLPTKQDLSTDFRAFVTKMFTWRSQHVVAVVVVVVAAAAAAATTASTGLVMEAIHDLYRVLFQPRTLILYADCTYLKTSFRTVVPHQADVGWINTCANKHVQVLV